MTDLPQVEKLNEMVGILGKVLVFNSKTDYLAMLIWSAQTRMRGILPSELCLYLAFEGKKSAGKTTATKCASHLAKKGRMYASVSASALKRMCDDEVTLCIDEVDALARSDDKIEAVLRTGNTWDAISALCDKTDGKFVPVDVKVGGPKAFNFRGDVDDALRSRCYIISMPSCKDIDIIGNGFFAKEILKPVHVWLDESVESAIKDASWVQAKVKEHFQSPEFKARWVKLGGDLGRNIQQAGIMLLVSDILGWHLDEHIKVMIDSQIAEDPNLLEKEIMANTYLRLRQDKTEIKIDGIASSKIISISSEELRMTLNRELRDKGQSDYTKKRFGDLKKELGWVYGLNERKDSKQRGKHILYFDEPILRSLGINISQGG